MALFGGTWPMARVHSCSTDGGEDSSGHICFYPVYPSRLFMPHWRFLCKLEGLYIFSGDIGGLNLLVNSMWLLLALVHPWESWHWDETEMTQRSISWNRICSPLPTCSSPNPSCPKSSFCHFYSSIQLIHYPLISRWPAPAAYLRRVT